jgi:hypothetical protein
MIVNHALQQCTTCLPDEYSRSGSSLADQVMEEVAAWIDSVLEQ